MQAEEGTKAGEFCVISQRSCVFGLWYYRLEQLFGDEYIFLNLFIDSGAVAAFSHLRLLHSFSQKNFKFPAKAQWLRPTGIVSLLESVLMCFLHMLASAACCLYHFYAGILKMGIQYHCFPKKQSKKCKIWGCLGYWKQKLLCRLLEESMI